jgi:hypothetical protein
MAQSEGDGRFHHEYNANCTDMEPAPESGKWRLIVSSRSEDHFYSPSSAGKAFGSLVGDRRLRPRRLQNS